MLSVVSYSITIWFISIGFAKNYTFTPSYLQLLGLLVCLNVEFKSSWQLEYAIPNPNPAPVITGHFLRLKNSRENTPPMIIPPPNLRIASVKHRSHFRPISSSVQVAPAIFLYKVSHSNNGCYVTEFLMSRGTLLKDRSMIETLKIHCFFGWCYFRVCH